MKEIIPFALSRIHTHEDFNFLKAVRKIALEELPVSGTEKSKKMPEVSVNALTDNVRIFSEKLDEFDLALNEIDDFKENRLVEEYDKIKTDAWRDAQSYIRVMKQHPDEATALKACKVLKIFYKYGELRSLSAAEKGGCMNNLIDELEAIPTEDMDLMNFRPWVERLRNANDTFDRYFQNRSKVRSQIRKGIVQTSRIEADLAYRSLVDMVNAMASIYGEELFINFINTINEDIRNLRAVVRLRKTLREKKETDDSTPPVTEQNEEFIS